MYHLFWVNKYYLLVIMERKNAFLVQIMEKLLLLLPKNRCPCHNVMCVAERWCPPLYSEAKKALDSVSI